MSDVLKQSLVHTAGPSDLFAVGYLQLCQISYAADPSAIPQLVASAVTPFNPGGFWQCTWGPVANADNSNLVFVAVYYHAPGLPVLAAVVIRGTDTDISDFWGILQQAYEDFDVPFQATLPWLLPGSPILVDDGTLDALDTIQGLSSGGQSLPGYLAAFLGAPANNNPVLVVTGHSLGGCLATVVAPWLKDQLGPTGITASIVPVTFAAPSAGNADFAAYYSFIFGYCPRYYNTFDIAPNAWWNLSGITSLYDPCGNPIPDLVQFALDGIELAFDATGASYAQQPASNAPLAGACTIAADWYAQVAFQHSTTTYMSLLGGTSVVLPPGAAASPRRRRVRPQRLAAIRGR